MGNEEPIRDEPVEEIVDTPEPMTTRPKYPYSAMLETDAGLSLFIVIGNNSAHLLNQGHPVKVQIDEKRLTPCKIKYVFRGAA